MGADIASLPRTFAELLGKPLIGLKVSRKEGGPLDKVYGEEAYYTILLKTIEKQPFIAPEVIKAELDKWWDAKYEEEKGEPYQKFKNREEFEGASQEKAPAEPTTLDEFYSVVATLKKQNKKKAKAYYDKWAGKWQ